MTETIAFIPARKGSKRVPNKNIRLFCGRPLVEWTLNFAKMCRCFDRIILSSDQEDILAFADKGVIAVRRPDSLAADTSTIIEVIRHTVRPLGIADDARMVVLMPTGPLRTVNDIKEAFTLFERYDNRRTVISVGVNPHPPDLLWRLRPSGELFSLTEKRRPDITRKQTHEATYVANDILVLDSVTNFLSPGRSLFGDSPIALVIPEERSLSIDTPFQFELAEMLFPLMEKQQISGLELIL